jgi:DNA-directed RNA polymerase specialized sigma24 family protein
MSTAKKSVVEAERHPSPQPWAALSARLVRTAKGKGLSPEDAEDCAQEALTRLIREKPNDDAPELDVRAGAALKLAIVDERRRATRQKEIPPAVRIDIDGDEANEVPDDVDPGERLWMMEMVADVLDLVGPDVVRLVFEGEAGYTETESSDRAPAGSPSTGALRKRLSRALPDIARRITDVEGGQ